MPYFITDQSSECPSWAVVKEDGELVACHDTKQSAIDQMVAVSLAEDLEPGGEYQGSRASEERAPAPPEDQIFGSNKNKEGSASGAGGSIKLSEAVAKSLRNKVRDHNAAMDEEGKPDWTRTTYGQLAAVYRRGAGAYSISHRPGMTRGQWAMGRVNAYLYLLRNGRPENKNYVTDNDLLPKDHPKSSRDLFAIESRAVDLTPPAYMRAAARRGLEYYAEGKGGDGLVARTIREARAMAAGNVTADKWVRIRAWIARHLVDLDSPAANPNNDDYPSAGVVAHLLWGSGPSKAAARRALAYAESVVTRLEEENRALTSARGEAMSKVEIRHTPANFEIRESSDGMTFEGYAAVFNSASEPLPFIERIAPGAFRHSLKRARNDIKLLWNHESGQVLGSTRAGTLKLEEDALGLKVIAQLPDTTTGRDAAVLLRRGDIDSMSFGFSVPKGGDSWSDDGSERTLNSVRLHEVSIVAFPAYSATAGTTSVRGLDAIAKRAAVDADQVADAMLKLEEGEELTGDEAQLLRTVIDELSPAVESAPVAEAEPDLGDKSMLDLAKAKLKLLGGM